MRLSARSIQALGKIVTGDEGLSPYRSGPTFVALFNEFGASDRYGKGFPSRWQYAGDKHHAVLVVNASKTMANFLFETMAYQKRK